MPGSFLIADEYRRLLCDFARTHMPGLASSMGGAQSSGYDPLRLLPLGQMTPGIDQLRRTSTNIPLEWQFGEYLAANSSDLMTARALGSANIGEALLVAHQYQHVQTNVRSFTLRSGSNGELTEVHHAAADDADLRFVFHTFLAAKISLIFRYYKGAEAQHQVDRRANCFGSLLHRFARELDFLDIEFRDSEIVLNLSRNVLAQGLPDMGDRQRRACDLELQRRNAEVPSASQWADRIRNHIRSSDFAEVSISDICDALRVQRRTLGRLLRDEGTNFTAILTELRREKALHLVRNTGLPLKRVAAELGFNSDASFHMAFKSWTGETPLRFRKAAPPITAANDPEARLITRQMNHMDHPSLPSLPARPAPIRQSLLATYRRCGGR